MAARATTRKRDCLPRGMMQLIQNFANDVLEIEGELTEERADEIAEEFRALLMQEE
jgi:hypothetical protein